MTTSSRDSTKATSQRRAVRGMGGKVVVDGRHSAPRSTRFDRLETTILRLGITLAIFAAGLTLSVPADALSASGNGRISIKEHKFFGPLGLTNEPTSRYFDTNDSHGHPTLSSTNATCVRTLSNAQGGVFAHLRTIHTNNSLDELPCGTHSGNSDRGVAVQVDGVLLIPAGASSLRVRAHNKSVSGTNRTAWFSLWTAEGPKAADLVERQYIKAGQTPESITAWIPLSNTCVSPGAFAFRLYIYDNKPSFGVNLRWSIDGGAYVDIPANAYSTAGALNLRDTQPANGTADYLEVDTDSDGVADWEEMEAAMGGASLDSDGDSTPDCLDPDSDNDNTPDGADPNRTSVVVADDSLAISSGGGGTLNVLNNDDFVAGAGVRVEEIGGDALGNIVLSDAGDLTYDDAGSPVGNYTINYDVCNDNVSPPVCGSATVALSVGPGPVDAGLSSIEASESSITANGVSTSTVTVRLLDSAGNFVGADGGDVQLQSTLGALSAVTDNGDGSYQTILTAGTEAGTAQITGTFDGDMLATLSIVLLPGPVDAGSSVITVSAPELVADETSTARVTVTLKDIAGNLLTTGGESVVLESTLGSLSDVSDNGDGTYSAVLTAGGVAGEAVLAGSVEGLDLPSIAVAIVANTFHFSGSVFRDTNGDDSLDSSDRDGQRSPSEEEISGVTVSLVGPGPDGELETDDDVTVDTTTTASPYSFEAVSAGEYLLVIGVGTTPEHYLPTIAAVQRITVSASGVAGETDFGYAPRVIAGVLTDHTGATLPGVVVSYTTGTGQVVLTTTKADGSYLLGDGTEAISSPSGELSVEVGGFRTSQQVVFSDIVSTISLEVSEQVAPDPTVPSTVPIVPSTVATVPSSVPGAPRSLPVSGSSSRKFLVVAWLFFVSGYILERVARKTSAA